MDKLLELTLEDLASHCAEETEKFLAREPTHDPRYCYELLRRAFEDRSEHAWTLVYEQYCAQVRSWVRRHPAYASCHEDEAYFTNRVFDRLWSALTPDKFARLSDTKSVMGYVQICVHSVLIDHLRAEHSETTIDPNDESKIEEIAESQEVHPVEQTVFSEMDHASLWDLVQKSLGNEQERLVVEASFMWDMTPRDITRTYPEMFQSVDAVYRTKENVLTRLRRNASLRKSLELSD